MQKRKFTKRPLEITVFAAMLAAISIICGKFLAFNVGEFLRFSFENLPILFAGVAFGPVVAAAVAAVADLVGCLLVGYAINPVVTVGAAVIGFVSGGCYMLLKKSPLPRPVSLVVSVALAHILGSVVIKTVGLAAFYSMPFFMLMLWRLLNYVIIAALETAILYFLLKNGHIRKMIRDNNEKKKNFATFANSFQAVTVPGLERIGALLGHLGHPEKNLKFIHVAGTNGKGSVSANLASILDCAGFKVGKYISPNLIKVNERISICGVDISDSELEELLGRIEPLSAEVERELGLAPTQFEIWTAAAFLYFSEKKCEYVVLEVGLGGELDATNIIEQNELAIITRLGLDHTSYLGNTIEEIAAAKAGIIKQKCHTGTVLTVNQVPEALEVLKKKADSYGLSLTVVEYEHVGTEGVFEIFNCCGMNALKCGIAGVHQIENASLAVAAAKLLGVDDETIRKGVLAARNPARFELIRENPTVIYDGGHNENGIEALVGSLERYFGDVPKTVIFACMADKDIENSLRMLGKNTHFAFTEVKDNPRALSAEELKARAAEIGFSGEAFNDIGNAYEWALKEGRLTVICGSLYLYKDFKEYLNKQGEK